MMILHHWVCLLVAALNVCTQGALATADAVPFRCFETRPGSVDRSSVTVRLAKRGWLSHQLVATMAEIVLQEFLGYNLEFIRTASGSGWLEELLDESLDADLENWYSVQLNEPPYDHYITETQEVLNAGSIGYSGRTGMYTLKSALSRSEYADYYRFYQNESAAASLGALTFAESRLHELVPSDERCAWSWCGGEERFDGYFVPPTCQEDPDSCLEILSAWVGYTNGFWEAKLYNNGIKAVWGYYAGHFEDHIRSFKGSDRIPVFSWYEPDPLLAELDAVHISLPDYWIGCDRESPVANPLDSNMACDENPYPLVKLISHRVRENAPEALLFFQRFELSMEQLNTLLAEALSRGSDEQTVNQVACDHITRNLDTFWFFAPTCISDPPFPVKDGDFIFNAESLECEEATVFYSTPSSTCSIHGTMDRSDRIIKLVRRTWLSHDLISMVAEVLLRDYLGFTVELVYNNRTGADQFGPEMVNGFYDVDMENWHAGIDTPGYRMHISTGQLDHVGRSGYLGRSGIFIQRRALQAHPMLDYFKIYTKNASTLTQHAILPHSASPLREVLGSVGVEFPVCSLSEFSWCGSGSMEGYWAPPRCLPDGEECVELVHGLPSWQTGYVEQLVKNNNLAAVVAYYGDEGARDVIRRQQLPSARTFSPFYWWEPDALLVNVDAVRLSFPDYSYGCDSSNTGNPENGTSCDFPSNELAKVASRTIATEMPEALYVLQRIEIHMDQLTDLMVDASEPSLEQRVCNFLSDNPEAVQQWAPPCLVDPVPPEQVRINDTIFRPEELRCKPLRCNSDEVLIYVAQFRSFFCSACAEGEVPDAMQQTCVRCDAGEEVAGSSGRCRQCMPGSFKSPEATACQQCSRGKFMAQHGASACENCNTSSYQDEVGATDCKLCTEILAGSMTTLLGADAASFCGCAAGTFRPLQADHCQACPEGMHCSAGADAASLPGLTEGLPGTDRSMMSVYPVVQEGYMTIAGAPFEVYECLQKVHCPGGDPGSCAPRRDPRSVACGICEEDTFPTETGCEGCSGVEVIGIIVALCIVIIVCVAAAFMLHRNMLLQSSAMLTTVLIGGQLITTLQTLTVFQQMSVEWKEPLSSVMAVLKIVSFDIKLLRAECVFGHNELRSYIVRQLLAPATAPVVAISLGIKKWLYPGTAVFHEFINTVGTIFNIFLISILISAVAPMVCYKHPGESGRSMVSSPSTLCTFSADHGTTVAVGSIASLLVPLPFLALTAYGIFSYPIHVRRSTNGAWFLKAFRFLFMRFHPSGYWFSIVIITRSLLCCLIPVLLTEPGMQVMSTSMVISLYVYIQLNVQPWRTRIANCCDAAMAQMVLMILLSLAVLSDFKAERAVQLTALMGFVMCLLFPLGMLVYMCRNMLFKDKYEAFICHHKADAAAQARLLKMLLVARTGRKVFIDSDDLIELDKLFDIVKTKVKLLLVYLTHETLTRPWCVGEITTAFHSKGRVKVQTVRTPSFLQPTEEEATKLYDQVDTSSCNLQEQGLDVGTISDALVRVVAPDTPTIGLNPALPGAERFMDVVAHVVNDRSSAPKSPNNASSRLTLANTKSNPQAGQVVVSADKSDDEAVAAASILLKKISAQLCAFVDAGVVNLVDKEDELSNDLHHIEASRACMLLLSRCSLDSLEQVVSIVVGMSNPSVTMIPVHLWDFKFPTAQFYTNLPNLWPETLAVGVETAEVKVRAFFKLITVFFATMSSDSVLDTQADQVVSRVGQHYSKKNISAAAQLGLSSSLRSQREPSVLEAPRQGSKLGKVDFV